MTKPAALRALRLAAFASLLALGPAWCGGGEAPDFKVQDIAGKPLKLSDFKGKVVILNFWAMSNASSVGDVDALVDLYAQHKKDGLVVIGVACDKESDPKKLQEWLAEHKVEYPVTRDVDGKVNGAYRATLGKYATMLPVSYVIDRKGMIQKFDIGPHARYFAQSIEPLLAVKGVAPEAPKGKEKQKDWSRCTGKLPFVIGYDKGLEKAQEDKRPVMLLVTTAGTDCHKQAEATFTHAEVVKALSAFTLVLVDADVEKDVCAKLEVKGYPTLVFLDAEGRPLATLEGIAPPAKLLAKLKPLQEQLAK